ncbi:MAG: hypothetical protein WC375_03370 [Methanomassiliicoccales archaeon]
MAAKIAVKYGIVGIRGVDILPSHVREFWDYDDNFPSTSLYRCYVRLPKVKKYITYLDITGDIWNPDFVNGLCKIGKIINNPTSFPTLRWNNNETLASILQNSPFAGRLSFSARKKIYQWCSAPVLCCSHKQDTLSFMAGVLAVGEPIKIKNMDISYTYIKYTYKITPWLKKWKIPIERSSPNGKYVFISPFWVALLSYKMPKFLRTNLLNIANPYGVDLYAPVLWHAYVDDQFKCRGLPYMKSRRTIFRKYKNDSGVHRRLEILLVEKHLTELDLRIKEAVKYWSRHALKLYNETEGKYEISIN